jgi:hypothetical protein
MSADSILGRRLFIGGATHDVFADDEGQYVLDDNGVKVRGVWVVPEGEDGESDQPVIVHSARRRRLS